MSASEINALPNGIKLQNRYVLERKLGAGGFGITYQAYDILNKIECAIKEYAPRGLVVRDTDGIAIRTTDSRYEKDFRIGKMGFLEEAKMLSEVKLHTGSSVYHRLLFWKRNSLLCYGIPGRSGSFPQSPADGRQDSGG